MSMCASELSLPIYSYKSFKVSLIVPKVRENILKKKHCLQCFLDLSIDLVNIWPRPQTLDKTPKKVAKTQHFCLKPSPKNKIKHTISL